MDARYLPDRSMMGMLSCAPDEVPAGLKRDSMYLMETGYKILRSPRRVRTRTRTRTSGTRRRGREPGSKNKSTIQRELLEKRELLAEGLLATEIMDQEIARLGELMALLYPWDEDGKQITGKSVNAYYWASELR